ncbi:MAG: histidinol-phosphate transaminase [Bacillota bacterium]|nr:histidinol-phosphate transaminase [Bacillota bacterium]
MGQFIEKKARKEIFSLKPYTPGKPIEEVKRELGLDDIIKLASNENPLGASQKGQKAIEEQLSQLHLYPDSNSFYLKQKLSAMFDIPLETVLVGNGSDELLKLLAETFLNVDDEIIIGEPSFSEYEFVATIMGAKTLFVPMKDFTHDLDSMIAAITPRTKMIIICNPNNPTGTIVTKEELASMMSRIPEDILVIFDEAYYEYVSSSDYGSGLDFIRQGRNAVVLRTFSKIYGLAALRIGYGITTQEITEAVEKVTEPFNVNMLAQIGALAALDDTQHVESSIQTNELGKAYLYKSFEELGLSYVPTEANFIFFDTGRNCREVFEALLRMGVIVRTGDIFGYPNYLRVTVGTQDQNQRFIASLKQVLGQ